MQQDAHSQQKTLDGSTGADSLNAPGDGASPHITNTSQPTDPYSLIDLTDNGLPEVDWKPIQPKKVEDELHSFVQDLGGLQISHSNIERPVAIDKRTSRVQASLLPTRSKTTPKRTNKRVDIRGEDVGQHRSSTPQSIASEMDPYTQWYQVMQNYYKQFYPSYDYDQKNTPRQHRYNNPQFNSLPKSAVPLMQPAHHQEQLHAANMPGLPFGMPKWSVPQPAVSGRQGTSQPNMMDYAQFYYQYYLNAMAANPGWAAPTGRTTPKIFFEPHIRATLACPGMLIQILPNRPREGEPGRVELIDINQLATDVVSEATSILADRMSSSHRRSGGTAVDSSTIFPSSQVSISEEGQDDEDDDEEEEEGYAALVAVWDRTDHTLYPGPLCHGTTLKHDVLAFLSGKVEDIQDRMPVDWDSAGLLLAYLRLLVKNNGIGHPSDVVNLLLENESSTRSYDCYSLESASGLQRLSNLPSLQRNVSLRNSMDEYHHLHHPFIGGGAGVSPLTSGRESPRILSHSASTGAFFQQRSGTPSSTGGASISKLFRKTGGGGFLGSSQERETLAVNRFRELLMHGHPLKALDQACQQQLWGHAFALAHRLGGGASLERVLDKFLSKAVHPSDPLVTLYHLTAGEMPPSVDQLAYTVGSGDGGAFGDWRPHLAMLLSAPEMGRTSAEFVREALERLGESLMGRRFLYAAQLCLLLASSNTGNAAAATAAPLHSRIWLLGIQMPDTEDHARGSRPHYNRFAVSPAVERAPTEAIQLTEVYEYAQALAARDRHFFFPQFLPFKFVYCLRLIDAGLIEKAFRYLEVLSRALVVMLQQEAELEPLEVQSIFTLASQCVFFAEKLQFHPEIGGFESNRLDWIDQLRGAYSGMCTVLGLPTEEHPFIDPPTSAPPPPPPTSSSGQHQQPNEVQTAPTPLSVPPSQGPHAPIPSLQPQAPRMSASAAATPRPVATPQHQPVIGQHRPADSSFGRFQSPPPEPIAVNHDHPPQNPPTVNCSPHHNPNYHQADSVMTHDNEDPIGHHPPETRPQHTHHMHDGSPPSPVAPSQQQHHQLIGQQQGHPSPHSPPLPPQPASPTANRNQTQPPGFFVPGRTAPGLDGDQPMAFANQSQQQPVYDYFADLQQQSASVRSRTVSSSSRDSSSAAPFQGHSSSQAKRKPSDTGRHHCDDSLLRERSQLFDDDDSSLLDTATNRRSIIDGFCGRRQSAGSPPLPITGRGGVRSRNFSSTSTALAGINESASSSSVPPQNSAQPPQNNAETPRSKDTTNNGEAQKSWLSSIFGRKKGAAQEVCLPDDSTPAIVWDETTGSWRDLNDHNPKESTPLPPPMLTPIQAASPQPRKTSGGGGSGGGFPRSSARSRYVNIMANPIKTSSSSKTELVNPLIPMPPSTFTQR